MYVYINERGLYSFCCDWIQKYNKLYVCMKYFKKVYGYLVNGISNFCDVL